MGKRKFWKIRSHSLISDTIYAIEMTREIEIQKYLFAEWIILGKTD